MKNNSLPFNSLNNNVRGLLEFSVGFVTLFFLCKCEREPREGEINFHKSLKYFLNTHAGRTASVCLFKNNFFNDYSLLRNNNTKSPFHALSFCVCLLCKFELKDKYLFYIKTFAILSFCILVPFSCSV